ncbi:MAG: YggT family protein [Clostridia bacterium]|nr:YggT family protein [Clostridia bacterium]
MATLFFILSRAVNAFLTVFVFMLLARVLWSFFADEESRFYLFLYAITEPVVTPVRAVLARIPFLAESPIDFSFMATCLIITLVQSALPL